MPAALKPLIDWAGRVTHARPIDTRNAADPARLVGD